jgi:hypothetical protein
MHGAATIQEGQGDEPYAFIKLRAIPADARWTGSVTPRWADARPEPFSRNAENPSMLLIHRLRLTTRPDKLSIQRP